jgi:ribosomal protein S18 acetylase RimI-like enzyme
MLPVAAFGGIEYGLFTDPDSKEFARLLGETFTERDPPAVAVGLTASEFEEFVALLCGHAATQGLTIIARSVDTGEMTGGLLAEDSAAPFPGGMERLSAKFKPIFDILGRLESAYCIDPVRTRGESAHFFLLGVAAKFAGKGIGQRLVRQCVANATRKGYRVAVTEATNRTSQHIFRKEGFVERVRGSYQDHRFEGHAFFTSIAEHGGPVLMDKLLAL